MNTVKELANKARDLELDIQDLTDRLNFKKTALHILTTIDLPDAMHNEGVTAVDLSPSGNDPAFEIALKPVYRASIPQSWTQDKLDKAFSALREYGAESLIKTQVVFSFPKGRSEEARHFAHLNRVFGPSIKEEVHHSSLTAWLRETVEAGHPTPPLDDIGAFVGSVAKLTRK